jgi:hypothetical protein
MGLKKDLTFIKSKVVINSQHDTPEMNFLLDYICDWLMFFPKSTKFVLVLSAPLENYHPVLLESVIKDD